jgi:hypothetical protein
VKLLPVLGALISLTLLPTGCNGRAPRANQVDVEVNKALARELFAALGRGDVSWLDEHYAEDFEIWTAGSLPFSGTSGKAAALEGMRGISAMFPTGIEFTIVAMAAEGDRVAIEAESHGVHISGKIYHNRYHFLMVARDGKITRFKEYMDTEHARDVLMSPPAGASPGAEAGGE